MKKLDYGHSLIRSRPGNGGRGRDLESQEKIKDIVEEYLLGSVPSL